MRRSSALATAASLCLLLVATACSGSDEASKEELVADLSETLQTGDDLDEETADCIAEIVVEDVGVEEMRDVDLTSNEPPDELQPEIAAATIRSREECSPSGEG